MGGSEIPPPLSSPKIYNLSYCEILHSQSLFIYLLFKQSCWGYFGPQTTPTLQSVQYIVRNAYNHAQGRVLNVILLNPGYKRPETEPKDFEPSFQETQH